MQSTALPAQMTITSYMISKSISAAQHKFPRRLVKDTPDMFWTGNLDEHLSRVNAADPLPQPQTAPQSSQALTKQQDPTHSRGDAIGGCCVVSPPSRGNRFVPYAMKDLLIALIYKKEGSKLSVEITGESSPLWLKKFP